MNYVKSSPPNAFVLESVHVESIISELSLPTYLHNFVFKICRSVHNHTIQINQPSRCNNFSILLLDVCLQLNMFRAWGRPKHVEL